MINKSICLLFVLAFIAQICANPDVKEAKAAAEKAAEEGKDKTAPAAAEAENAAKNASDAKDKAARAGAGAKDHKEELAKGGHQAAKDCHMPGAGGLPGMPHSGHPGPFSKTIKQMEEVGKRMADQGVKRATGIMSLFGL